MALGTNYRRNMDKDAKRVINNLDRHFELMTKFIEEGLTKEEASKKAFKIITGYDNK